MIRPPLGALRYEAGEDHTFSGLSAATALTERTRADGSKRRYCTVSATVQNKVEIRFGDSSVSIGDGTQAMAGFNRYPMVLYLPDSVTHFQAVCATAPATLIIGWLDWT